MLARTAIKYSNSPPPRRRGARRKSFEPVGVVMMYETENLLSDVESPPRTPPIVGALPSSMVMSQRCAAMLRAYLKERGLPRYSIYCLAEHDLWDVEWHLEELGESADWESMAPLISDGEPLESLRLEQAAPRVWNAGVL